MDSFGLLLRNKRKEKDLSLQDLSSLLSKRRRKGGIAWYPDVPQLSRWETGRTVPRPKHRDAVKAIADILDMDDSEKNELLTKAGLSPLQPEEMDIDARLSELGPERWRKTWFLHKYLGWNEKRISDKLNIAFWDVRNDIKEAKDELERLAGKIVEDLASVAKELKSRLFIPPPETLLIDDFGGLGRHSIHFRRDVFKVVSQIGYDISEFWVTKEGWIPPGEIPPDLEIEVVVSPGALELCFPLEEHPLFQKLLSEAAREKIPIWKKEGGRYLTMCYDIYREIRTEAKSRTFQLVWEDTIRKGSPPLNPNFADLIYQLAILHRRTPSKFPIPDSELYQIRPRGLFVSELYLGLIHLANEPRVPLPRFLDTWAKCHREMIRNWSASPAIRELLELFGSLREIEQAIKEELATRVAPGDDLH